jgi:hypothetical protein
MNKAKKLASYFFGKKLTGKKEFSLDLKKLIGYKQRVPLHYFH